MHMMRNPGFVSGYMNIFPNFNHGNRKDGLGLPSLSPKAIGPVDHKQPGLPIALNLENFHQGNKVFRDEIDQNGNPTKDFYDTRIAMYQDPIPHRHKDNAKTSSGNKNIPIFSVWITPDGKENRIDYFTSRQFYCTFYERATLNNPDYQDLMKKLEDGYSLRICGFDAYPIPAKSSIEDCYKDISLPFGHELVLYTMLTEDPKMWPWKKYQTFNF